MVFRHPPGMVATMDAEAQPTPDPARGARNPFEHHSKLLVASLVVAGLIAAMLWVLWFVAIIPSGIDQSGTPVGWDFRAFHSAATLLSRGEPTAMYDSAWPVGLDGPPFVNPPFTAFFFLPFVAMGVVPAWVVWTLISVAAMAIGFRALDVPSWPLATAATLLTVPVFFALRLGQTSLIVFMLMSLGYAAMRHGRFRAGGAVLGFIVFKPQLLVGFVFWWLSRWRTMRSAIVGAFATGGALVAVTLILFPDAWVRFFEAAGNLPKLYAFGDSPYYEFAMWNLVVTDGPANPTFISVLSIVLTAVAGLALVWFVRRVGDDLALVYAAAVVVGLIAAAHLVVHDWTLLLIAGVLVWQRLPQHRLVWASMGVILLLTTIFSPFLLLYQLDAFGVAFNAAPAVLLICTVVAAVIAVGAVDSEVNETPSARMAA
ncbi:MAG: hypothetical protein BMS9Abin07_1057 [Acidimicrobiia bacterium]|nr:MAG: hypothetical protein BMS9Abin07_1057 [Acidimicrobiia bacterium]